MDSSELRFKELAAGVWSSLGVEVEERPASPVRLATIEELTAVVRIFGPWRGALTVRCSAEAAKNFASAMFGTAPADLGEAEVADAVGELAHMAAGNLKFLFGDGCQLSPPAVTHGPQAGWAAAPIFNFAFHTAPGDIQLTVVHTEDQS